MATIIIYYDFFSLNHGRLCDNLWRTLITDENLKP